MIPRASRWFGKREGKSIPEAKLARGEAPEFLEPIDLGAAAKISAWRFRK
jgi:hypothetical protein